jgi:hypothetical protein
MRGKEGAEVRDDLVAGEFGAAMLLGRGNELGNKAGNEDRLQMSTRPRRFLYLNLVGLLGMVLTMIGCDTFAANQREVIAQNAEWTITAIGDLHAPGRGLRANLVRFEAARLGVPYVRGGPI